MVSKKYEWRVERVTSNKYAIYFITEIGCENGTMAVGSQMCQPLKTLAAAENAAQRLFNKITKKLSRSR
jgi:hypothetical protein